MKVKKLSIPVSDSLGAVSAEIMADDEIEFVYVFAHGAGAGMNHPFMVKLSSALCALRIGTVRFNFPYMERGGKRPDAPAIAEKTVQQAIQVACKTFPDKPLLAGGKSFGGRMTSQALSKGTDGLARGIVFVGFPLHAPGKPGTERASHLQNIALPMLFLQGTRDALAEINLIEDVCNELPSASLKKFEGADHSFKAGKQNLIAPLAETIYKWASDTCRRR